MLIEMRRMPISRRRPIAVAAIIERHDNHILIVLPPAPDEGLRLWRFPGGLANSNEPSEASMRRMASEQLGVHVEIVVGQPPVTATLDGREVEMRYFFCGLVEGEPRPGPYAEIRWVSKGHLREYEFDPPFRPVVEFLLES